MCIFDFVFLTSLLSFSRQFVERNDVCMYVYDGGELFPRVDFVQGSEGRLGGGGDDNNEWIILNFRNR